MPSDLENNLIAGGLTPAAAKTISNAIANLSTAKTFTGRQLADATPADKMRMIDGDSRRYLFTNLDYPLDSPFRARVASTASQYAPGDRSHPYQESQPASANPTLATPNVKGGKFVEVAAKTTNAVAQSEVALRVAQRGGTHARLNSATGEIEAVPLLVEIEPPNEMEAFVEERADATVIRLRALPIPRRGGLHSRINPTTGEIEAVPLSVEVTPENRLEAIVEERASGTVIKLRFLT
jgi:hypothetical protein